MDLEKQLEKMVLACIDTAKAMLDEYETVIPFGLRAFNDSEDMKMNCPAEQNSKADWNEQIEMVASELKGYVEAENISAIILVTDLKSEDESGVGLQIETEMSSVLFVYPYHKENDEWVIDEPIQTDQLLASVYA
ncbi:MAG: hypothetical protein KAQ67_02740 [Gammaproteobacteria bacterium]|nr:hypothetical protein [Gammaproteobacteria bacterium]